MAGRPRLLPLLLKEQLGQSLKRRMVSLTSSEVSTGVAGHVFKFALIIDSIPTSGSPFSHFDPFGTELLVSRGGATIRIILVYKDPSNFRRSSWRPRANLDFTVPTLMSSVAAISS